MNLYTWTKEGSASLQCKKMPGCKRRVTKARLAVHLESGCLERSFVTKKPLLFAALLFIPAIGRAQVVPAGKGGNEQLFVGVTGSDFDPDYGWQRLYGFGAYGDYNLSPRLGVEGEARFHRFHQLSNIHEDNYVIGPKYNYHHKRYTFFAKGLVGLGYFNFPANAAHGTYFAVALGGGVDYRLSRRIYVRGEYEYQMWPGFVGPPDFQPVPLQNRPNGLTPNGFGVGVSYRIF
jgi:opacity protein-like surface antigen